jgi:hypothetical protein
VPFKVIAVPVTDCEPVVNTELSVALEELLTVRLASRLALADPVPAIPVTETAANPAVKVSV